LTTNPSTHDHHPGSNLKCVNLFPAAGPLVAEAVTCGVRVRASVVCEVESSQPGELVYAYCIRYSHVQAKVREEWAE